MGLPHANATVPQNLRRLVDCFSRFIIAGDIKVSREVLQLANEMPPSLLSQRIICNATDKLHQILSLPSTGSIKQLQVNHRVPFWQLLTVDSISSFEDESFDRRQGVYVGVVQQEGSDGVKIYVGSSYGKQGMVNRIRDHQSPRYREKYPNKPFYVAMREVRAGVKFISLVTFLEVASTAEVLFSEGICACMLGSYNEEMYQNIRNMVSSCPVDWTWGLNNSDPLRTLPRGPETIGRDLTAYRRERTLNNCLNSGPFRVCQKKNGHSYFVLFNEKFTIPRKIVVEWGLAGDDIVNVVWHRAFSSHPNKYALNAQEHDPGSRLGIQLKKTTNGRDLLHWIQSDGPAAFKIANTITDFLDGMILGKDYEWQHSRKYIFSEDYEKSIHGPRESSRGKKHARVGLPYGKKDFKWDRGMRRAETKPSYPTNIRSDQIRIVDRSQEAPDTDTWDYICELGRKYLRPHHDKLREEGVQVRPQFYEDES